MSSINDDLMSGGILQAALTSLDANGDVTLMGPGGEQYALGRQGGSDPMRVFAIGDSLTMRQFQSLTTSTGASVSGTDVTLTGASTFAVPGTFCRIINQANAALNIDVPIIAVASGNFTVRYPFDCTGLFSGNVSYALYCQLSDTGWLNYAAATLAAQGKTMQMIRNCGDGGDTVAEVLARIPTELAPLVRPGDIIIEMSGINNINAATTAAEIIATKSAIYDALLATGATVHVSTITQAESSAYWTDAAAALAKIKTVNGYIRGRCKTETRLKLFDGHAALGSGDYAATILENNGVHYKPASAALIAAAYVAACGSDYRKSNAKRWLSSVDNYASAASWNLLTNCDFVGATGATPPTDWTAGGAGTKTYTLAANSDGTLTDLEFYVTHTGATIPTLTQDISARVSGGDKLIFGTEYETIDVGESQYFRAYLEIVADGQTSRHFIGVAGYAYASGGSAPPAGVRYLFEHASDNNNARTGVTIPVGFTSAKFIYSFGLGASGDYTARVAKPFCRKV